MSCEINANINKHEISAEIHTSEIDASIVKNEVDAAINKNEVSAGIVTNHVTAVLSGGVTYINPPGGNDTEIQFNDGGDFGGSSKFVINKTTGVVTFGEFPVGPSSDPVADYQLVNKKYVDDSISGGVWGSITGTLSDQTDLQDALDLKLNISDFSGYFDTDFAGKTTDNLTDTATNRFVTDTQISNWNTAYSWGDHAGLYDLLGTASGLIGTHESTYDHSLIATALQSETDPIFTASEAFSFEAGDKDKLDGIEDGAEVNNVDDGTATGQLAYWDDSLSKWTYGNTDNITDTADNRFVSDTQIGNWDTAYGWGNHALAGYLTAESDTLQSVTDRGATTTNNLTIDGGGLVNSVLNINGAADSYIRSTNLGQLQLGHGGTEVLTVAPTGKVGFGTTDPITDFMIYKTAGVSVSLVGGNTGNATIDLLKDFGSTGGFGTAGAYGFRVGYNATSNLFKIQAGSTTTVKDALCITRDTAYVGFGTEAPTCVVDVNTLTSCGANLQGGVNMDVVDPPAASPALALTTGGSIDAGTHYYRVSYITALGGTNATGLAGPVTTDTTNNAVQISSIPISSDSRVTGRKIWRTKAGATNDAAFLVTTINDNTTTTYLDTKADADLTGGIFDGTYAPNTTHNYLTVGGVTTFGADKYSTRVGLNAGRNLSGASAFMVAIGGNALYSCNAFANTALGYSAGYYTTTGRDNVFVGYAAGQRNTDGSYNVLVGDYACLNPTTSYMNVVIGHNAMVGSYGTYSSLYNVAIGYSAGRSCLDAESNVFIGWSSGFHASQKTDVNNSMCLGRNTYSTADGMFVYGDNTVVKHIFQSGNVGYGTDDPQKKLDIRGDGSASFRMTYTPSSVYTDFTTTTAGYYKIEPTGSRVGIKCTPTEALDVYGNVNLNNQYTQVAGNTNPGYYLYKSGNLAYGMKLHYFTSTSQFGTFLFCGNSSNTFLAFGRSPNSGIADNDFVEFARFDRNTGYFGINTIDPQAYLDVNGDAFIGDGTNYTEIKSDGEINLHGTARVYKNQWITVAGLKAPGTKPATYIDWGINGALEFSNGTDDTVITTIRIPQDMDRTDAPEFKIGFASATNTGNVVWQLEYLYITTNEDTTASAQETLTTTQTISSTANGLTIATITGMDLPSASDQLLVIRLKRLGANASDTLSDDVAMVGCGLKYTSDKLGVPL